VTVTEPAVDLTGPPVAELDLTVLMPCLNESRTLEVCIGKALREIGRLGIRGEVLVADNGSTDGSQQIARDAGARVVDITERGYGAALRGGIAEARGRWVIMADADDSYSLDDLGPFVEALQAGHTLVMGNRFQGGVAPGAMPPLHRYLGNPVLSWIGRRFFRIPVGDFHCGMRGFDRDAIRALELHTSGMEFASEMVVKAALNGLDIVEVPTRLQPDGRDRAPHLRTWHDGWRHLRFLLAFSPRWMFLYPGVLLTVLGVAGIAWLAPGERMVGGLRFNVQTMLFFAAGAICGVQLVWFAVIAKVFAIDARLLPPDPRLERALRVFSVERCVGAGLVLALVGLIGLAVKLGTWAHAGFGELQALPTLRLSLLFVTALVCGTQTFFSAFLLGLMRVERS
jgi:glycosyltransferase involved in cell wall biosynthesis